MGYCEANMLELRKSVVNRIICPGGYEMERIYVSALLSRSLRIVLGEGL
jgi:hypothetical protein